MPTGCLRHEVGDGARELDRRVALKTVAGLFEVLDSPSELMMDKGTRTVDGFHESVKFEGVSFAYEEERVLAGVDFAVVGGVAVSLNGFLPEGRTSPTWEL